MHSAGRGCWRVLAGRAEVAGWAGPEASLRHVSLVARLRQGWPLLGLAVRLVSDRSDRPGQHKVMNQDRIFGPADMGEGGGGVGKGRAKAKIPAPWHQSEFGL